MTNIKCIRCGTINVDTAQICKVCEIELNLPLSRPLVSHSHQTSAGWQSGRIRLTATPLIGPFHEVGDVLGPTFRLFTKNLWLITKLTFVIVAPFEIFKTLSIGDFDSDWQIITGTFVLDLLCKVLIAPALIYALMQVMETGIAPGVNESYRWGVSKLGKLLVCAIMAGLLQAFGFTLCIVPGIIVGLALALVYPLAILENGSPIEILRRSAELTKGHRGKIFGATLVIWLLLLVVSLPGQGVVAYLAINSEENWPFQAAVAIFVDVIEQVATVLSLVIYLSIRALWSQSTQ